MIPACIIKFWCSNINWLARAVSWVAALCRLPHCRTHITANALDSMDIGWRALADSISRPDDVYHSQSSPHATLFYFGAPKSLKISKLWWENVLVLLIRLPSFSLLFFSSSPSVAFCRMGLPERPVNKQTHSDVPHSAKTVPALYYRAKSETTA